MSDDTADLTKQVRDYLESHKRVVDLPDGRFEYETPPSARPALAALTTLVERLETAEQGDSAAWEDMRAYNLRLEERAWAAEAEVKRLREYYEASEAVERGVVDFDLHETAVLRLRAARAALD